MDNYTLFSKELSICYFLQNEEMNEKEMNEAFEEDETIIQGILMGMIMVDDEIGNLWSEENE